MSEEYLSPKSERRAFEIHQALLRDGQHRCVSLSDLLIAATAENSGHIVLGVDKDFEPISQYIMQPTERFELEGGENAPQFGPLICLNEPPRLR